MNSHNMMLRLVLSAFLLVTGLAGSPGPAAAAEPSTAAPAVTELPEATQAGDLAFEPEGTLWFDGRYGFQHEGGEAGFVGRLESGGQVEELALPSTETAGLPVIDADGGVWFPLSDAAENRGAAAIGHFSSGGDFERYPLGSKRGYTELMARSGTDLWVGGAVLSKRQVTVGTFIDQVSTSPTVTVKRRIRLNRKCTPSAIAADESEVWFAEGCENQSPSHPSWRAAIVHVEPNGKLKRYRLPRLSYVTSLAIGADGTVWFGSFGTNGTKDEFGYVGPSGSLTRYRVGHVEPGVTADRAGRSPLVHGRSAGLPPRGAQLDRPERRSGSTDLPRRRVRPRTVRTRLRPERRTLVLRLRLERPTAEGAEVL